MNMDALLLDASSEILMLLDAQSLVIVAASQAAHEQLRYLRPALLGLPIGALECAMSDLFFWEEMSTSDTPLEAQGSYLRGDGSVFDVRKVARRCGAQGQFYALRARSLRGPQRPEPELTDPGLHLAATLEATEDCILLTDNDGAILNMNRRFSDLWSLPQQLLSDRDDAGIVTYIDSVLRPDPELPGRATMLSQVIGQQLDPGGDSFETLYLQDGRVIECVSHPARQRDRTIGRVFCYRDVTERAQHEQSLKEARDKAEQATHSKGQFLANMSHEIRTPMNAILGMLKLLHGTDLNPRQQDYASKAEGAAQSLLGLLNDILDFSKIDAGKMALDRQPFSVDRLLRDLSVILSTNLGKKPVDVLFDIDPATPKILVGDLLRLQQVLINLSGNAIKFTAQGEVVVQIKVLALSATQATLRIAVTDSGIGIAPEHLTQVFEDFSQAEASTTRRFGGTGLGLSISKRLVALMGAELAVDSVLGQGSSFHFTLSMPVAEATAHAAELPAKALPEPLSVLVVDDNAVARELLAAMVHSLGWQVDTAADGMQAIALVKARAASPLPPYQAIFMDWEMPGMDGWQTIAQIRQTQTGTDTPITVMVTAHGREILTQRSTQEQASLNAFLVKPVTASMMRDVVADALAGRSNLRVRARVKMEQAGSLQGMRLLVVEDNIINQQVARELLTGQGASVEVADNGLLGVAAVARAHASLEFDAVLMDVQMPVMDGFAATRAIRLELGLRELPIIAMTANALASDRQACLEAGMNDHIGKPFNLKHLVGVLLQITGFKPALAAAPEVHINQAVALPGQPAAVATAAATPPEAEMDVATALAQMAGRVAVYIGLTRELLADLQTVVPEYRRLMNASAWVEAARLMHTLTKTAATLGANALSRLAADFEVRCKTPGDSAETQAQANELEALINATSRALEQAIVQLQTTLLEPTQ